VPLADDAELPSGHTTVVREAVHIPMGRLILFLRDKRALELEAASSRDAIPTARHQSSQCGVHRAAVLHDIVRLHAIRLGDIRSRRTTRGVLWHEDVLRMRPVRLSLTKGKELATGQATVVSEVVGVPMGRLVPISVHVRALELEAASPRDAVPISLHKPTLRGIHRVVRLDGIVRRLTNLCICDERSCGAKAMWRHIIRGLPLDLFGLLS